MFNSREYEWADITIIVAGRDITGIRGVKYTRKIEREAVYAKGRKPRAIQSGNESYEGEFTMLKSAWDAIQDAAGGDAFNLSVDSEVGYGNPAAGDALRADRILGIRFTEDTIDMKQGDKFAEITVPWIALDIHKSI